MALTRRQKEVLDFIAAYQVENGYSPSYEEIARGLNLASIATVHKHISALDKKNYLQRSHNQSRSIEVAPRYLQEQRRNRFEASLEVPVLGSIAAGQPVETYDDRATVSFADFVGQKDTYALRVRGNSMIEDHICEGDMILVENTVRGARRRYRGGAGGRNRNYAEAVLPRTGQHDPAAAGECGHEPDPGSRSGRADPGPPAGRAAEVLIDAVAPAPDALRGIRVRRAPSLRGPSRPDSRAIPNSCTPSARSLRSGFSELH